MSFSLQKEDYCWKKLKQRQLNKGGQVIDLWWPGYWPYNIYIYAVELLSGPSLANLIVTNWAKLVKKKHCLSKKHYKIGVSADFSKKGTRTNLNVTNWAKLAFFLDTNLVQLVTSNLAQLVTFKNGIFFAFFHF